MRVLTLNAGSSTLKFGLYRDGRAPTRLTQATLENAGSPVPLGAVVDRLKPFGGLADVAGVGHRVVHGGPSLERTTRLDDTVVAALERLSPLDPDHLPAELAMIEAARAAIPSAVHVACFDTAFHRTLPRVARLVPIPAAYAQKGVRRYGFHGLSCQFLTAELARVAGEAAARGRLIIAHLGSGSSLTAVRDGRSVDTTMGFTPTSGVPMSTRSGDVDPGVLVYLARHEGLAVDALDHMMNKESGLLGVSGVSGDMRELLAREGTHAPSAEAVALYCYAVAKAIGALAATLDGVDTLVFSAGIGERSPVVRARICERLRHLGVALDHPRNDANAPVISVDASACTVRVIRTDEECVIAEETLRTIRKEGP